jgi:hypothetical protein
MIKESGLLGQFTDFFSDDFLSETARQTKFIQRSTSTISGLMFLSLNVFQEGSLRQTSLNEQCDFLEDEFGVRPTKQSLDERYNTFAVSFLKACFANVVREVVDKQAGYDSFRARFGQIRVGDATSFQLPAAFAPFYESAGGDTSPSSIKIQYEYDVLSGGFLELQLGCGRKNDAEYLQTCSVPILPKDLVIKDLGYYQHKHFNTIAHLKGYFISRYKSGANLYSKNPAGKWKAEPIATLLSKAQGIYSHHLFLGQEKLPVRLVLVPVPEQVALNRIQKLQKTAKHKKWNLSGDRLQMCHFNIFLTNIEDDLNDQTIVDLYSLRWQIELIFKIWKSLFEIDQIGHTNIFRFECYLYGRLIAICLLQNIHSLFKEHLLKKGFEPSEWKGFKILKKNSDASHSNLERTQQTNEVPQICF